MQLLFPLAHASFRICSFYILQSCIILRSSTQHLIFYKRFLRTRIKSIQWLLTGQLTVMIINVCLCDNMRIFSFSKRISLKKIISIYNLESWLKNCDKCKIFWLRMILSCIILIKICCGINAYLRDFSYKKLACYYDLKTTPVDVILLKLQQERETWVSVARDLYSSK